MDGPGFRYMRRLLVVVGTWAVVAGLVWCQQDGPPGRDALEQVRQRITELRAEIARHDELYFRRAAPEISDFAYDQLKQELRGLEDGYPALSAALPSIPSFGDDRTGHFPTHRHLERMLSLNKGYSEADLRAFDQRIAQQLGREQLVYVIEPKVDGIAISVTFADGRLVRAATRGNGSEGDDITANALMIRSLPRQLAATAPDGSPNPVPVHIELRGEIHLSWAAFERINREREAAGEMAFAHPRNLAAGTVKLHDPGEVTARNLDLVFFGMGACEPSSAAPATLRELREQMVKWGLPVVAPVWSAQGMTEVWEAVQTFEHARHQLDFPTDGAVVKVDSIALQRAAGASEAAPRWAMAYKSAPERAETRLLNIIVQVGRTGVLTPVAEFEPVVLGGSTVTRASLHNRETITHLDLRIGDQVFVEKAGGIVPELVGVNMSRRTGDAPPYVFPDRCPSCAADVHFGEAIAVYCANAECPDQVRRRLEHFASSAGVAIDGLGPAVIATLVERGRVRTIGDLYRLQRSDFSSPGAGGATSPDGLLAAIERSKHAELWRVINGLGIPGVGAVTARRLAETLGSLEALARASPDALARVPSVGPATANSIASFFAASQNRDLIAMLLEAGVRPTIQNTSTASAPLAGKVLVLTGMLPTLTRAEAMRMIEAAGGTVRSEVGRSTNYLIVGEAPGGKLARARELGIEILDEAGLRLRLAAEHGPAK